MVVKDYKLDREVVVSEAYGKREEGDGDVERYLDEK